MSPVTRAKLDLIFSVAVFGTIGIFVRSIPLPSSVIALVRGAVGAAFLLLLARIRHTPIDKAALRRRWKLLVLSAAMMSFNWITLFEAYRYTTVATATLCYYTAPIFVTLASPLLLKERLTARKLFCVCLALTGMVFVSGVPQSGLPGPAEGRGILLALCSAVLYASVILLNKYLSDVPAYDRTVLQLTAAAVVMVPYILLTEDLSALTFTPLGTVLLLIVAVFHTGWCYSLYFGSMTVLSAQTAALFSYIDPIVAILLSALLLKEPLGWNGILGAALVLGSTLVSELPVSRKVPKNKRRAGMLPSPPFSFCRSDQRAQKIGILLRFPDADLPVHHFAVLDEEHRGHGHHPVLDGQFPLLVHIHLGHQGLALIPVRQGLHHRSQDLARAAPHGGKIDHGGLAALQSLVKFLGVQVLQFHREASFFC